MERRCSEETLIAAFNFSSEEQTAAVEMDDAQLTMLLDTDWEQFGGSTTERRMEATTQKGGHILTMAPFSGILLSSK